MDSTNTLSAKNRLQFHDSAPNVKRATAISLRPQLYPIGEM